MSKVINLCFGLFLFTKVNRGYHDHVDRKYGSCSQLCSGGDVAKSRTVYWTAGMDVHEGHQTNITVKKRKQGDETTVKKRKQLYVTICTVAQNQ